jgi:hypothetical protein
MDMAALSDGEILDVPLDLLSVSVLAHLSSTNEWNLPNFMVSEVSVGGTPKARRRSSKRSTGCWQAASSHAAIPTRATQSG